MQLGKYENIPWEDSSSVRKLIIAQYWPVRTPNLITSDEYWLRVLVARGVGLVLS